MQCKDCGSRRITWNIEDGYVIQEYDENGHLIESDFHCEALTTPQCAMCDSTNLED